MRFLMSKDERMEFLSLFPSLSLNIYIFILIFLYESESLFSQSCLTLCDPMDCSLPGSSVHGIFQARVLEWIAISFSRGFSRPRYPTRVFHIVGRRFTVWATKEAIYVFIYMNACIHMGFPGDKEHTVSKVMSLFFNVLSRFVLCFLPKGNHLLILCILNIILNIFNKI